MHRSSGRSLSSNIVSFVPHCSPGRTSSEGLSAGKRYQPVALRKKVTGEGHTCWVHGTNSEDWGPVFLRSGRAIDGVPPAGTTQVLSDARRVRSATASIIADRR